MFDVFCVFFGVGRCSKGFLAVFGSVLTKYQPVWSHGDPKYIDFYVFRMSVDLAQINLESQINLACA